MAELTVNEMLEMQRALQEKYKDKWEPICIDTGKNKLLWMIGEIGEVADIVKKNGDEEAVSNPELRAHLIEEMADVLMYYHDVMLCYGITSDELREAYTKKFERNMKRWSRLCSSATATSAAARWRSLYSKRWSPSAGLRRNL